MKIEWLPNLHQSQVFYIADVRIITVHARSYSVRRRLYKPSLKITRSLSLRLINTATLSPYANAQFELLPSGTLIAEIGESEIYRLWLNYAEQNSSIGGGERLQREPNICT